MNTSLFKNTSRKLIGFAIIVALAALISIIGVATFANASPDEQTNNKDSYFSVSEAINNPDYSVSTINATDDNAARSNELDTNQQALVSDSNQVCDDSANDANVNIRPTDVERSDAGEIILYTDVNYSTMGASAAINRLNQLRWEACAEGVRDPRNESRNLTTADYVPIKWSTDMEWIAQTRASEGCFVMDHTRPTGKSCFTCTHNGNSSYAEVLAWNYTGMAQGIEQWYSEKYDWVHKTGGVTGHYTSMIDPDNIYFGLGTAKVPTNGYYTTAGEFNSDTGLDEAETPEKGQYKQAMAFRASAFDYDVYYPTSMEARSSEQVGVVGVLKQETSVRFPVKTNDLDYESSDTSVAEVNEYGYIWAKKAGTAKISVYKENTLSKFEFNLTVTPSTRPEAKVTSVGDASVTLSWGTIENATKYAVCEYIDGNYYTFSDNVKKTTFTCTPIQNEIEHYFLVQAYVNGQWSKYSSINFVAATPHGRYKPDDVQGSAVGSSITLTWTAVPAAEKYAIATKNSDGTYKTYTSDCKNTSYTIRDLEDGTQYKCLVQAYFKGDRWSTFSDSDLVTVTTKGTRPVVSAAASGDGEVTLSWPAIDNATNYVAYEVVGSEFRQIGSYLPSTQTSLVVNDLANGYKHTFLVQAKVGGQWSKYSDKNYASATPTGTVKPTISSATVAGTSITLTWNHVPGVSAYAIATKVGSSKYTTYTMSCTQETYTIKNLEEGVTYDCLVQANINGNWSEFSSSDLKQATTKGTRPVVDADATGDGEVTLSWDAIDGADKYAAYELVNGNFVAINENIPSGTCTITKDDLANGYEHTFLVQAHVGGTWSKFSERNYAYATPTGTIKPTISSVEVTGTNIKLTWNKVPGASKYAIATKVGSSGYTTYTMEETGLTYTIKGLEDGVTYDCLVQANIYGNWSAFSSSDLKQATTKGTRPVVEAEATGDGEVTLSWDAIDGADKYAAYELVNGNFVAINENIPAGTCTVIKDDLANGYQHTFLVQAHVGGTWSKFSERNYAYATPTGTVKPTLNQPTVAGTSITLTWDHVPGVSAYAVATKVGSSKYTTYTMSCTEETYTIKNLEEGVTYDCLVQANINGNWSSFDSGDLEQATTKGTRPAPTTEVGDGSVKLTWDAIDNATKYVAYEVIDGQYVQIGSEIAAPTTTVTKTDLVNEQQHTFLVQAYVGGTWSKYSENNYVYATPHGAVKPKISTSSSTDSTITVNWEKVSGSDYYCAAISTDGSHWTNHIVDKTVTTYTYSNLVSNTTYKVLVQRKVGDNWSSFTSSDIKSVTTKQPSRTTYSATESRKNAILCNAITSTYDCIKVEKTGDGSSEDDDFYGYNAAILAKAGGLLTISDAIINTAAKYANAVFSYGTGTTVDISDSTINTTANNSGGVMVTGGGVLTATDVNATTMGDSSAPIRSDKGGGTLTVNNGKYISYGTGSPTIYSTAAIKANGAELTSNHSEGVIVEGKNSATLNNCTLIDTNDKLNGKSTTYKNIFLYQSQSGDAEVGTAEFSATNSSIVTNKGDAFYVTNNTAKIDLTNNTIVNNDSTGYLLRAKADAWGKTGKNGGLVTLNLTNQKVAGNIYIDNISTLAMTMKSGSKYTGTINGANTAKTLSLNLSADSNIVLTGDSYLTSFTDADTSYSNVDTTNGHLYVNGVKIK